MRLFNLANPELSTCQSDLTPDGVLLGMMDEIGRLDSASLRFLELVYQALLEASRQDDQQ
jgi:hypothetical protein